MKVEAKGGPHCQDRNCQNVIVRTTPAAVIAYPFYGGRKDPLCQAFPRDISCFAGTQLFSFRWVFYQLQVQISNPVPNSSGCSTWLHKFKVPERFSRKTTEAIADGVISKGVRVVVASVALQMLQHTQTPTSEVRISLQYSLKAIQRYCLSNRLYNLLSVRSYGFHLYSTIGIQLCLFQTGGSLSCTEGYNWVRLCKSL